ncbi:ThiF family adenylyltransferase [Nonomuraea sp. 10N515B]|uniref:ThiF family adenylyltransferase n=1 Tax=Nonomuraea sp. 10N515B TaxID=3457422 RepID=UPI003FCE79D9
MRPRVKPALRRIVRDEQTLQYGVHPLRAIKLSGLARSVQQWIEGLDGTRDLARVLDAANAAGLDECRARSLLDQLTAQGALHDAATSPAPLRDLTLAERDRLRPDLDALDLASTAPEGGIGLLMRRRAARVRVYGAGRVGAQIVVLLAAAGVGHIRVIDSGAVRASDITPGGLTWSELGLTREEGAVAAARRLLSGWRGATGSRVPPPAATVSRVPPPAATGSRVPPPGATGSASSASGLQPGQGRSAPPQGNGRSAARTPRPAASPAVPLAASTPAAAAPGSGAHTRTDGWQGQRRAAPQGHPERAHTAERSGTETRRSKAETAETLGTPKQRTPAQSTPTQSTPTQGTPTQGTPAQRAQAQRAQAQRAQAQRAQTPMAQAQRAQAPMAQAPGTQAQEGAGRGGDGAQPVTRRRRKDQRIDGQELVRPAVEVLAGGTYLGDRSDRPDLIILAPVGPLDGVLVNELTCLGIPHLLASAFEGHGTVGPLVLPGETACLHCLDLTRRDHDPTWPIVTARLGGYPPGEIACDTTLATLVAAQATGHALAHLDGQESAVTNGTMDVSPDWHWKRQAWRVHPQCRCMRNDPYSLRMVMSPKRD